MTNAVTSDTSAQISARHACGHPGCATRPEVVITGIGLVLPNCDDRETFWTQLRDGVSQLSLERDSGAPGGFVAVGRVNGFDGRAYLSEFPESFTSRYTREQQFYISSLLLARADAGLDLAAIPRERIGLFDGTSRGNFAHWYDRIRAEKKPLEEHYGVRDLIFGMPGQAVGLAAALLGVRGPTYTFNGTCSSGAIALGHALRELETGAVDVAFGTGHDVAVHPAMLAMYRSAGLLSTESADASRALRPYGASSANAFGEGAVTLVMETRAHAERRGAPILASLAGYRYGNGGTHPTDVDVSGEWPAHIVSTLLRDIGLPADDVDFVIGHGNGVRMSDRSELAYMRRLFEGRLAEVPLLSTKPIYGHTLGASSALSVAAAALMLHHGYVIPTINVDPEGAAPDVKHQAGVGVARECRAGVVVSYGIGGQNAALVVRRPRS